MRQKRGFTLIELLVVIAIISLLLSIIVPSLKLVKQKAASIVCMTNAKNLSLGWFSYKEENNGSIMSARMDATDDQGAMVGWIGIPRTAAGGTLSITQTTPEVTDEDEIRGLEVGRLWDYVKASDAYNCPADKVKSKYDGTEKLVTFAIPSCLYEYTRSNAPEYNKQIKKYSEISSPAQRYNFVETAEQRNWTMSGHFVLGAPEYTNSTTWGWWGPMAINHGDSSVLGFCDGHAEVHRWQNPYTRERVEKLTRLNTDLYTIEYPPADQTEDLDYMARGWAYRYRLK